MSGAGWRIAIGLTVLTLGFAACKKQAPGTQSPDAAGAASDEAAAEPEAEPDGDGDLDALVGDLDRAQSELTIEIQRRDADPESSNARQRCERICDLSAAVCDLEGKICALADAHRGEDRYAAACSRAGEQCSKASEACRACSQ